MTLRAFILGLLAAALIAWITPINDYALGNTHFTGYHFPPGAFFLLLMFTLIGNVAIKAVRRSWGLRQAELMLIWCMMLVSCTVPSSGLMRYLFSVPAAPAYYQERSDWPFMQRVVERIEESGSAELVLTTERRAVQVERFFEGTPGTERVNLGPCRWLSSPVQTWRDLSSYVYLEQWKRPLVTWGLFIAFYYLASLCLSGILRKQWVEFERLQFPLARVPADISESAPGELLPKLAKNRAFLVGAVLTLLLGFLRMSPVLLANASEGWRMSFPVHEVLWETPLNRLAIFRAHIIPLAIGFAFLVPADVSLSVWLFFILVSFEFQVSHWLGVPMQGGKSGPFLNWQQAGAYVTFAVMMLWATRRHLADVVRKAFGGGRDVDDSQELVPYAWGFWGLAIAVTGMVTWYSAYGLNPLKSALLLMLVFTIALGHARMVAQGGIFFVQHTWNPAALLHTTSGGTFFGPESAIAVQMQNAIMIADARELLLPHSMNAMRIGSVFDKHRRFFVPALAAALLVAFVVSAMSTLYVYYSIGGLNTVNWYGMTALPQNTFRQADTFALRTLPAATSSEYLAFGFGALLMFFITFMRAHFYWWPLHSLGLLIANSWSMQSLWFPFLLGWSIKVAILKFGRGMALRSARHFFVGVIIGDCTAIGISTFLGLLLDIHIGQVLLPP